MGESSKDHTYWLTRTHVFTASEWGPEYCRLCLQAKVGEKVEHLDPEVLSEYDPRRTGPMLNMPVARPRSTVWRVEGWNDDGGSTTYEAQESLEKAISHAQNYAALGDRDRRRYRHYVVHEIVYETVCDDYIHPLPEVR